MHAFEHQELTKSKLEILSMIDPTFDLEVSWFAFQYKKGVRESMRNNILAALPSQTEHTTVAKSLELLDEIKGSKMFEFAKDDAKSDCTVVLEWVRSISKSRQPTFRFRDCVFLQSAKERLGYFCIANAPGASSSAEEQKLYGKEAPQLMLQATKKHIDGKEDVALGELKLFDTFCLSLDSSRSS